VILRRKHAGVAGVFAVVAGALAATGVSVASTARAPMSTGPSQQKRGHRGVALVEFDVGGRPGPLAGGQDTAMPTTPSVRSLKTISAACSGAC
jgi:hypothetical protein